MSQRQRTFSEAIGEIRASWAHELKTQSPGHIFRQALKMLYWIPAVLLVMLYVRVRRLVVIGYRIARDRYFRLLIWIEYGPGAYERMREEQSKHTE